MDRDTAPHAARQGRKKDEKGERTTQDSRLKTKIKIQRREDAISARSDAVMRTERDH